MKIFRVKNRRLFFRYADAATIKELIQIIPNLSQYSANEEHPDFDMRELLATRLDQLGTIRFGIDGVSVYGFAVRCDKAQSYYEVILSDYATNEDWQVAIDYVTALAKWLGSPVCDEKGWKISPKKWKNFDYQPLREQGLSQLMATLEQSDWEIEGVRRMIYLGQHLLQLLKLSSDKLSVYDNYVRETQYVKAYIHEQTFGYNAGKKTIYGNYSIADNLKVVLPLEAFVELHNENVLIGRPLTHWTLTVSLENEDGEYHLYKVCEYDSFIKQLQPNQYTRLDEQFIIIDPMTKEELDILLDGAILMDNNGQFKE